MRRMEQLVNQVRLQTENTRVGITDGISDEEFIQFVNDGQEDLLSKIFQTNARAFSKVTLVDMTRGQANYSLPADTFMNSRIVLVEYSNSGAAKDFRPLTKNVSTEQRHYEGYPQNYIIQGGDLIISPTPDRSIAGGIRVTYDPIFPRVDKRRTVVGAVTISVGAVTALTLSNSAPFVLGDYNLYDYLSFVDAVGTVKTSGLRFTAVDAGGVVTIPGGSFTQPVGSTIAIGDYVVLGPYASTHSGLPDICEKFLLNYCAMRIFARDSSSDIGDQMSILDNIESAILSNYQDTSGDLDEVPVVDYSYYPEV